MTRLDSLSLFRMFQLCVEFLNKPFFFLFFFLEEQSIVHRFHEKSLSHPLIAKLKERSEHFSEGWGTAVGLTAPVRALSPDGQIYAFSPAPFHFSNFLFGSGSRECLNMVPAARLATSLMSDSAVESDRHPNGSYIYQTQHRLSVQPSKGFFCPFLWKWNYTVSVIEFKASQ